MTWNLGSNSDFGFNTNPTFSQIKNVTKPSVAVIFIYATILQSDQL